MLDTYTTKSGMLIPIPPIPGTQSGTFNLLSPRITVFITDTITLNGALKISRTDAIAYHHADCGRSITRVHQPA